MFATILLVIFGDSLSSPDGCQWPKFIQPEQAYVRNFAQKGLTLRDFDFPDHLAADKDADRNIALIYKGTNDAGSRFPARHYKIKLQETVDRLNYRRFEVYVAKLPILDILTVDGVNPVTAYNARIDTITGARIIHLTWGTAVTEDDGLHPTCMYHRWLYWKMMDEMGL